MAFVSCNKGDDTVFEERTPKPREKLLREEQFLFDFYGKDLQSLIDELEVYKRTGDRDIVGWWQEGSSFGFPRTPDSFIFMPNKKAIFITNHEFPYAGRLYYKFGTYSLPGNRIEIRFTKTVKYFGGKIVEETEIGPDLGREFLTGGELRMVDDIENINIDLGTLIINTSHMRDEVLKLPDINFMHKGLKYFLVGWI